MTTAPFDALPVEPSLLGESPFWHPDESALYWCDITGRRIHRWRADAAVHDRWQYPCEPGCIAPLVGGGLLAAMRDGLWRVDTTTGARALVCAPPYDPACERFNDGKADPTGRFWVGTMFEPRTPHAALYRFADGRCERIAGDITTSNGLAWSPDGGTLYWSDTRAHVVRAFDVDLATGGLSNGRDFARFAPPGAGDAATTYGGRPDGAAVDCEGAYWVAMFEGQRLLRLGRDGRVLEVHALPVRCPTMPCFGGSDLRTLYVTTARANRSADELASQLLAGRVLSRRVDVPGLPVNFVRLAGR
ncbi:MAG TPA: SMP-30/gluconolactonase/LRE family protein [Burkholderiaceae bacterium]|nr:SMP-30/gluconolactonase/LRE family protein [Burkholderiaceae bacterium]